VSKVLGQVGVSLADQYDVKGSIVGVAELDAQDVKVVHDLSHTMLSERLSTRIIQTQSAALSQSQSFNLLIGPAEIAPQLPGTVTRLLGVMVFADATRVSRVQCSINEPATALDLPFFVWDASIDLAVDVNIEGDLVTYFRPTHPLPWGAASLLCGLDQPQSTPAIAVRGITTAFGAGTVTITARFLIAFAASAGLSSYGVTVPSW